MSKDIKIRIRVTNLRDIIFLNEIKIVNAYKELEGKVPTYNVEIQLLHEEKSEKVNFLNILEVVDITKTSDGMLTPIYKVKQNEPISLG